MFVQLNLVRNISQYYTFFDLSAQHYVIEYKYRFKIFYICFNKCDRKRPLLVVNCCLGRGGLGRGGGVFLAYKSEPRNCVNWAPVPDKPLAHLFYPS